ncbi:MAG: hypothetical protein Q8L44_13675 [Sulfuritalea sp.]|nr:hypothetical protein [Sulfuritalea sp.]
MNIPFTPHGLDFHFPRFANRPATPVRVATTTVPRAGWMTRLAAWAERQPLHHHAGSWERFR